VPASSYEIWLAPLHPLALDGDELVLQVPTALHGWVAERFGRVLQTSVAAVLGPSAGVRLEPGDDAGGRSDASPGRGARDAGRPAPPARAGRRGGSRSATSREARRDDRAWAGHDDAQTRNPDDPGATTPRGHDDGLNPKYTFDQFVIGPANRFAHAAALAVAELPGQAYNPLFVYGPPGVGKTHLLHSIGNYVRSHGGGPTVRCVTVETFTNEFVAALRQGGIERFKALYRQVGVLLIDDIQFLAQKAKTEEEFFHTFNALQATGSQLVLTSDRVPRDLDGVHDRLRERFEAGLVTDIEPPDRRTRMTVLRKRVAHDRIALEDQTVLDLIADRVTTNVRALEGALIRVVAFASLTGRALDPAVAGEVLDGLYPASAGGGSGPGPSGVGSGTVRPPTPERIQDVTAAAFGLQREELLSTCRTAHVAWARQVAMFLVREHTDATLPAVGRAFGGRNHTTVLHACRRVADRLAADPEAHDLVRAIELDLTRVLPVPADTADGACAPPGADVHETGPDRRP
jgi:chromosomal replication initiator protein